MGALPNYVCQVCGKEEAPEVVAALSAHGHEWWVVHRIELAGGVVNVMTCPECSGLTQDLIFQSYRERIRSGLVPGFH